MTEIYDRRLLLENIQKYDSWIIYGAGVIGQGLFCLLKIWGYESKVKGFAVSNHTDHLNEFMNVPIKGILEYDLEEVHVLIAVKRLYLHDITVQLGNVDCYYADMKALREVFEKDDSLVPKDLKDKIRKSNLTDEQYVTFCIRQIRRVKLDFEVNIADHCNLNCQCCNHFSPLADHVFLDIDTFTMDLTRIRELTGGDVGKIWLIGGEPLLHPQITEFMYVSRRLFPKAHITLNTNGILLLKKDEEFWQALRDTQIEITLTKYPIQIDYKKIEQKINLEKVRYAYTLSSAVIKTTYHLPLDIEGRLDGVKNYLKCGHANECITLRGGGIYTCPIAPNAHYFNTYFGKNLYVGDKNCINIYEAKNVEEILEFLKRPIPFCNHCNIEGYTYGLKWNVSERDIKEWT